MDPVSTGAAAKLGGGAVGVLALSAVWLGQVSEVHGIPERAAIAYVEAGRLEGCDWRDLAAVGWAESGHGTSAVDGVDRAIDADGVVTPALEIWDVWDYGGGPMGFLHSTWEGGGYAELGEYQDVDAAARATCRYLKAKGYDTDKWSALKAYNGSGAAASAYADKTTAYAAALPVDPGGDVPAQEVAAQPTVAGGRRSLGATLEAAWQGLWAKLDGAEARTAQGDTPTMAPVVARLNELSEHVAPRADSAEVPASLPQQVATKPEAPTGTTVEDIAGIRVDASIAAQLRAMLAAAAADGVDLRSSPRGSFRSQDDQLALRAENGCPDVWLSDAFDCVVPTARPGRSLHEHGLAVDFVGTPGAWEWLAENAARFGAAMDVEGEPWHASFTPAQT